MFGFLLFYVCRGKVIEVLVIGERKIAELAYDVLID